MMEEDMLGVTCATERYKEATGALVRFATSLGSFVVSASSGPSVADTSE